MENTGLGSPDTVVIHVGTNDLRRSVNLDYVIGDVHALVTKTKTKLSHSRLVLSGILRRRDMSWWRISALNNRYDWIAKTLEVTFVDPNSWVENWDFGRDGLHINRSGVRRLRELYSRVCGFGGGGQKLTV
jgi:lysophospholipase L1-like esterase